MRRYREQFDSRQTGEGWRMAGKDEGIMKYKLIVTE